MQPDTENKMGFEWGKFGLFILSFVLVLAGVMVIDKKFGVKENETSMQESQGELKIEDLVVGTGEAAVVGNVTVHYTGTLTDGTKFDSSVDRGTPFTFSLGAGEVIPGWDQGIVGLKVGGKRKLTIPPSLGYGEAGYSDAIPPNSTLIFEVELIKVE